MLSAEIRAQLDAVGRRYECPVCGGADDDPLVVVMPRTLTDAIGIFVCAVCNGPRGDA